MTLSANTQTLLNRRAVLGAAYRLFYAEPLNLVRGQGVELFDGDGRRYLDAYNNVPVLGHAHPAVIEAFTRQASQINTHTRYLHDTILSYAETLVATFPAPLRQAMFTCSGSEANDLALRIAMTATGGSGVIVTSNAYHGVTALLAGMSPSLGLGVAPAVRTVPPPDSYRTSGDVGAAFGQAVAEAIADLQREGIQPAALLVDTTFASDGIFVGPQGYLDQAVAAIRAAGGLFIADEVQGGFGRSGQLWTFLRQPGLVPDMVTLGKPMGNGHPVGGVVTRPDLLDVFGQRSRYFNTFGGNTVSAAVGLAVLSTIQQQDLPGHAASVGAELAEALNSLKDVSPLVADVRGVGFYYGVELVTDHQQKTPATAEAKAVVDALAQAGVLVGVCGAASNVLKIRPPLAFQSEHIDELMQALRGVLSGMPGQ
ncbi:aspartate aminotransferase family protein [Insolitispirillum peregrinum]|uniref:aspartate aminotransferase family protein n=1 Tax=Insolitispirillum peregrinum TaxID=80876 RepID=UPI0036190DAE